MFTNYSLEHLKIKVKENVPLCLINQALCHKDLWYWSALLPGCCTPPGERATSTHLIGGVVVPRASLCALEKRKSCLCHVSNSL
jgi:hypothetical protein